MAELVDEQLGMLEHVRYYMRTQIPDVQADSGVFFGDEEELYVDWEGSERTLVIGPNGHPLGIYRDEVEDLGYGDIYAFLESVGDDLRESQGLPHR